jgi:hypothetical protein
MDTLSERIECKFCSRLYGNTVFHESPECFSKIIIPPTKRLSKTVISHYDDDWNRTEE